MQSRYVAGRALDGLPAAHKLHRFLELHAHKRLAVLPTHSDPVSEINLAVLGCRRCDHLNGFSNATRTRRSVVRQFLPLVIRRVRVIVQVEEVARHHVRLEDVRCHVRKQGFKHGGLPMIAWP